MGLLKIIKDWWNEPSLEDIIAEEYNDALIQSVLVEKELKKRREEKLKSYETMTEKELLIEIAKNTLMEAEKW